MLKSISVRGAREHNLKDVSIDIPRDTLTVITGLSGSGQVEPRLRHHLCRGPAPLRRIAQSAYARQFLELMQKPDVDHIEGLSPRHLDRAEDHQPQSTQSTVATVTEIYDYMRLLWARVGVPYSPATGLNRSAAQTVSQMVDRVLGACQRARARAPPRPRRARPQGRVSQGTGRMAEGRLHSASASTARSC